MQTLLPCSRTALSRPLLRAFAVAILVARVGGAGEGDSASKAVRVAEPRPLPEVATVRDTDGVFLSDDDGRRLWQRALATVASEWPIARVVEPDFTSVPPRPGIIESSWIEQSMAVRSASWPHWPVARHRAIVRLVPAAGGAWLEGVVETQSLAGEGESAPDRLPLDVVVGVERVGYWQDASSDSIESRRLTAALASRMAAPEEMIYSLPPLQERLPGPPQPPWAGSRHPRWSRAWHVVAEDYRNFYSCESLTGLTAAFGAGALMANTGFDETMQQAWQRSVTPSDLGTFFSGVKDIGEGRYALSIFSVAAVTGYVFEGRPAGDLIGEWGTRSLRMFVVGAPPVYVMQRVTGGSRPSDNDSVNSGWKFFQDKNGVSGHAFVGAIPFLAAAGMCEDPWVKGGLYVCSTFVGFSRITDDAHYPSQAFLGWYIAFASMMAVNQTDLHVAGLEVRLMPMAVNGGSGVGFETRW